MSTEQKDYTKYTFEKDSRLELPTTVYAQLLQGFQSLADKYQEDFSKYKKISNLLFAYLQKEKVDDTYLSLNFEIFNYCSDTLKSLFDAELITFVPLKFDILNVDTDKIVSKKIKGKNYKDIFSIEKTADSENKSTQYLSGDGQVILRMLNTFQGIFMDNIDKGNGISLDDLAKKSEELKVVKDGE
jgi:hypothetical protein